MTVKTIRLKNFCSHRDLGLNFTRGLNGIIGANGRGKSTVIEAIQWLFTGYTEDTRERTITLGETSGYAVMDFELQGREGRLERHLDTSKTVLEYAGQTHRKAADVKALWDRLLNIDGHIFNNVLVSRQGEIHMLFSGDRAIRERTFQKIFMVPPTEKLRSLVWDKYLKTMPLETALESPAALNAAVVELENLKARHTQVSGDLAALLDGIDQGALLARQKFIEKCEYDARRGALLLKDFEDASKAAADIDAAMGPMAAELGAIDPTDLAAELSRIRSAQAEARQYADIARQRSALTAVDTVELQRQIDALTGRHTEASERLGALNARLAVLREDWQKNNTEITRLSGVKGQAVCPVCGGDIKDLAAHLAELETRGAVLYADGVKLSSEAKQYADTEVGPVRARMLELAAQMTKATGINNQIENFDQLLRTMSNPAVVPGADLEVSKKLERHGILSKQLEDLRAKKDRLSAQVVDAQSALQGLSVYDGESMAAEQAAIADRLGEHHLLARQITDNNAALAGIEVKLKMARDAAARNRSAFEKNGVIARHKKLLTDVYDVLHASKFPRALIESYTGEVERGLVEALSWFDLPYSARILPGFEICMFDADGRCLPKVSGGQKVIVGFCLRHALYRMFAQDVGIWILDEPTNCLREDNVYRMFNALQNMRHDNSVGQVIIIDHHAGLRDVVDNCIDLDQL